MERKIVLTPLDIYKLLEKNNCKRCMLPSCLAFAAAVIGGQKQLSDCPLLSESNRALLSENLIQRSRAEPEQPAFMAKLLRKVRTLDFDLIAKLVGGEYDPENDTISIRSLGKHFYVDRGGVVRSECHIIPWVEAPLLSYICCDDHEQVLGEWISFREIKGGIEWRGLFRSRCEMPLRQLADNHPELLTDIVDLFSGKEVAGFDADISLVLLPFPHIPILICYQAVDGDLESELNIFFDKCCATNLHVKSLYTLSAGLVKMFERIAANHY